MNRRAVIVVFGLLAALIISFLLLFGIHPRHPAKAELSTASPEPSASAALVQQKERKYAWQGTDAQLPPVVTGKYDPTLPQWTEWRRRNKEDKKWEWKTPIAFYGRVLDQNNNPVIGAGVDFQWTDISSKGTSNYKTTSDGNGLFKLENVRGRNLGVQIRKEGYLFSALNPRGFEYSAFFDENYYLPDPDDPVIFRMHKKEAAEPLIKQSEEIKIPASGSLGINLVNGQQGEAGAHLVIDLLDNSDPTGKRWVARLRAADGGVQLANDEFPTTAPAAGYVPEITINQDTPEPSGFQGGSLYKGGKFFVKTPEGYALVEFRMIPGNQDLRLSSYLNPNPNSRNLEYDPSKRLAPSR